MTLSFRKNSAAVRTAGRRPTVVLAGAAAALAAGLVVAVASAAGPTSPRGDVVEVRAAEPTQKEAPLAEAGEQAPVPVEDSPVPAPEAPVVPESAGSPAAASPGRSPSGGRAAAPRPDMSAVVVEQAERVPAHVPAPAPAPQASPEPTGGIGISIDVEAISRRIDEENRKWMEEQIRLAAEDVNYDPSQNQVIVP
jgi:hypothetical protein